MPENMINSIDHPINSQAFRQQCKAQLDAQGAVVLPNFLTTAALQQITQEGESKQHLAWFCQTQHNVYLLADDAAHSPQHPRNRLVTSSKGCITDDQIDANSPLRQLYNSEKFQAFLCHVLAEDALYPYADPLSSINLHYAKHGQELGWHFDNSSFAITLLIQKPQAGGQFQYFNNARCMQQTDMGYPAVEAILNAQVSPQTLTIDAGTLVLFRGQDALHRVTPTQGDKTRMLVVLAYNNRPNIALSQSARMTFYGRLH